MIPPASGFGKKSTGCSAWIRVEFKKRSCLPRILPSGTPVLFSLKGESREGFNSCTLEEGGFTDVFIAGSGEGAKADYEAIETCLARSAAVNFIDGELVAKIRSKNAHYVTRHQICGKNIPWHMTNTSEPHADDMLVQASKPFLTGWSKGFVGYECSKDDG